MWMSCPVALSIMMLRRCRSPRPTMYPTMLEMLSVEVKLVTE